MPRSSYNLPALVMKFHRLLLLIFIMSQVKKFETPLQIKKWWRKKISAMYFDAPIAGYKFHECSLVWVMWMKMILFAIKSLVWMKLYTWFASSMEAFYFILFIPYTLIQINNLFLNHLNFENALNTHEEIRKNKKLISYLLLCI